MREVCEGIVRTPAPNYSSVSSKQALSSPPSGSLHISFTSFLQSCSHREVERQVKVLIKKFGYFLSMSQQAVSAHIIPNSAVGIFSSKTEGKKTEAAGYTNKLVTIQI
jgi:hypothetical protein